jgi:hypothetical protein
MEMFTYTKLSVAQRKSTLATLIANVEDTTKGATDSIGKATAVKVFADARMAGVINHVDGQHIGRALHNDLEAIANNPKRGDKNRKNAAAALKLFSQWRKDFHAAQDKPSAPPVAPTKPRVIAKADGTVQAASLEDLTAMMMTLTSVVNTLVARS